METEKDEIVIFFTINGKAAIEDLRKCAGHQCRSIENQCKFFALTAIREWGRLDREGPLAHKHRTRNEKGAA
ncbi:MAG: hypothetical protein CL678_02305 [Bdellovibrionaceae bacterium]|nr:hypothetical protein [Pseudobdellovibrionaceae bacterium]